MEKILIFIKHRLGFLWGMIEWGNGVVFSLFYASSLARHLPEQLQGEGRTAVTFRKLQKSDAEALHALIHAQESSDLDYFSPHGFDLPAIRKQFRKRAFLMMGAFDRDRLAGYFFLRFFANRQCFVGRIIDSEYRGKGIGNEMNRIMYRTAWSMGFRCLSTMSKNNRAVMKAHSRNSTMVVLKELQNEYILVEFVNPETSE